MHFQTCPCRGIVSIFMQDQACSGNLRHLQALSGNFFTGSAASGKKSTTFSVALSLAAMMGFASSYIFVGGAQWTALKTAAGVTSDNTAAFASTNTAHNVSKRQGARLQLSLTSRDGEYIRVHHLGSYSSESSRVAAQNLARKLGRDPSKAALDSDVERVATP